MENKLAGLYNDLANQIISMIPTDFEDVYCMCEVQNEGRSRTVMFGFNEPESKTFIVSPNIPSKYNCSKEAFDKMHSQFYPIVDKIYGVFVEHEQEPWILLDLYFNCDGKFKVDFTYESTDYNKHGPLARSVIWSYKKMGIIPDSPYFQEIIDEYIKETEESSL